MFLLAGGSKPLPGPMLEYHQHCPVPFTQTQQSIANAWENNHHQFLRIAHLKSKHERINGTSTETGKAVSVTGNGYRYSETCL